jgi:RND family efflux transporter MFP subunit
MKKAIALAAAVFVLAAAAALMLASKKGKAVQTPSAPPVSVDTVQPARQSLARFVEIFGTLSPKNAAEVKSEIPGRVFRLTVKEWDNVRENDLLLELDPTDPKLNLSKIEAGLKMARAQLLQAQVDLSRAKREMDRGTRLKEGGLVTGQDIDDRKTAVESAQARVALAQAQVVQAESQVAEGRRNVEKTTITSPIQGVVSLRKVDAGDWVDKGFLLFSIVDNRVLDFTANVPAIDLCHIQEGQTVTFTVDGLPDRTFQGLVKRINPMVAASDRTGRIVAEVKNDDGALKGGVFARGRIIIEEHTNVLAIPKAALNGWDINRGVAHVFVIGEGGLAQAREVAIGLEDQNMVEIRSGLDSGDKVVVRGGFNVREGDRVRISDCAAPGA